MFSNCGAGENSWEPLGYKIKLVNPKGNEPWIFTGRAVAEAEALQFWSTDEKNWLTGKDLNVGKGWTDKEKGTENEVDRFADSMDMNLEQTLEDSGRQRSLVCCSSSGRKESDRAYCLNTAARITITTLECLRSFSNGAKEFENFCEQIPNPRLSD